MKHLFKTIGWIFTLSVFLFTGCQQDEALLSSVENSVNNSDLRSAKAGINYLANTKGVFVLSEGNMTTENGTLSFVDGSVSTFPATNWVYGDPNPTVVGLGNVSQDLFIANNKMYVVSQNGNSLNIPSGTKHILVLDNYLIKTNDFNPNSYFPTGWGGPTPTHLAVSGNSIYVRTNNGVVITSESTSSSTPTSISGITNPSRTRMAMVQNSGVKYLYVGSESGVVYRINTSTNAVSNITVPGKVAGLVAVRRSSNTVQYVYALSILSSTQAVLSKISGTTVLSSDTITSSFDASLFIPSVGLCCYAGGVQDVLYFRSNGWNPTQIFKYAITSGTTGTLSTLYTIPSGIDSNAQIIYGDLGVDQNNGDVYFGYVGSWGAYATVNGVGRIKGGNPLTIQEYKASATGTSKIDTRFTAGIYFTSEFDM